MKNPYDSKKSWRFFMVNISLTIILFLSGIFFGFVIKTNRIIESQMLTTAQSYFKNILLTRRWNAEHGGVYVEKIDGVTSNPYLDNPDITTIDGRIFTKKNPALMTREISEYAKREGGLVYHITSLIPLNPGNAPDTFEQKALRMFENGVENFSVIETLDGKNVFRYMAPLRVEDSCLACHRKQGYEVGDVRGGISIAFDISKIQKEMKVNRVLIAAASLITAFILIMIILGMVARQKKKLTIAYQTIAEMAVTDDLTRMYNRRHFHSSLDQEISRAKRYGHPVSLLMLDIDYFKRVNDTYGHQTGDKVLIGVADTVKSAIRENDIAARYGGEEIAIILPETAITGAVKCAEKIRKNIQEKKCRTETGSTVNITVSIGVSSIHPMVDREMKDEANGILKMADEALYMAKAAGRNTVVKK